MNGLLQSVKENVVFCLVFLGIIVGMFVLAYVVELAFKKKNGDTEKMLSTRKMAMVGVFSATAVVLYVLDFPVPFAPPFYKLDFSEIPVLVGSFAFGPVAGVMIEFVKILLKLLLKGTDTAFVGDLANFMVGCSFILPASFLYQFKKSKKNAILGCITGTLVMTVFGTAFNAVYLIPTFAKLYGMPLDVIIAMGAKIHASIDNVVSLVVMCVAPLNLVKGTSVSLVTVLVYKKLSPILKSGVRR